MGKTETKQIAELIAMRLKQGWESQADRLWERALIEGADDAKLEAAVHEAMREKGAGC